MKAFGGITGIQQVDIKKHIVRFLLVIFIMTILFPWTNAIQSIVICFLYLSASMRLKKQLTISRKPRELIIPSILLLFGLWVFIGIFFSLDPFHSIKNFEAHCLRYIMLYFLILEEFRSEEGLVFLFWAIFLSSVFFCLLCILNSLFMGVSYVNNVLIMGTAKNNIGFMLILGLFCSIALLKKNRSLKKRFFLSIGLSSLVIMIIIPQCRGSIIGLVISMIVYCICNKKDWLWLLGLVALILLFMPPSARVNNTFFHDPVRLDLLEINLQVVKDYPVFGTGITHDPFFVIRDKRPGEFDNYINTPNITHKNIVKNIGSPHIIIGQVAATTGLPGAFFFLCALMSIGIILINLVRQDKSVFIADFASCLLAAYAGFLVKGMFEPIFAHETDSVLYLIFSMTSILWIQKEKIIDDKAFAGLDCHANA